MMLPLSPTPSLRNALLSALMLRAAEAYTVVSSNSVMMYKNIDPIVFPGSYSKSHLHTFFGSDAVTANTNSSAELLKGCTALENPNDLSVYWVPTLLYTTDSGSTWEPVPLSRFSAYYNLGETEAEIGFPADLKMVAGDAMATTADAMPADAKVEWWCEGDDVAADANGFPSSTCSTHLQTLLYFPQCVNPTTLETAYKSRDHGTDNWCPEGSKRIPQLRFSIRYDLRKALPDGWSGTAPLRLACGTNIYCSHGDFINGWVEDAADNMVATTESKRDFSAVDGSLGKNGETMNCEAKDAEPDKGTSDYAESVSLMGKRDVESAGWVSRSRLNRL